MQPRDGQTRRLEASEMWIRSKMERISWTDNVTNEYVLRKVNENIRCAMGKQHIILYSDTSHI